LLADPLARSDNFASTASAQLRQPGQRLPAVATAVFSHLPVETATLILGLSLLAQTG
jgi:hypothetical protein